MRITAHSLVPSSPMQYVHLGYTSAILLAPRFDPFFLPALCVVVLWSAVVAIRGFRKSRMVASSYILLAVTAFGLAAIAQSSYAHRTDKERQEWTQGNVRRLSGKLESFPSQGQSLPTTLKDFKKFRSGDMVDGWRRPLRMTQVETSKGTLVTVTSKGRDGRFDTTDDISSSRTIQVPPNAKPPGPYVPPGNR